VTLRLKGAAQATTKTDSSGAYRFAGPAGEVQVSLAADSFPPGYELSDVGEQAVQSRRLNLSSPAVANFTVRAQRVVEGVVSGFAPSNGSDNKPAGVTVTVLESGRTVTPDSTGHFVLRGLPAGRHTLVVKSPKSQTRQVIEVSAEAGSVTRVQLQMP
jgi:hypothetical protein